MSLFGTDGIRGEANRHPITPELFLRAGQATARVLRKPDCPRPPRVIIGKDTRLSGYMLETALTAGLLSAGAEVLLVGPLPTPAVAHLTRSMVCTAGMMLTASHNPYTDNGLKIFGSDGYKLSDALENAIEKQLSTEASPTAGIGIGTIGKARRIDDARGRYIEFAKNAADNVSLAGLKIVLDCGNGAASAIGPSIFEELGAEVIPLGVEPNGRNINANVGALHPGTAAARVREHGADLGISFDGDADRVIFTDADGHPVNGDRVLALTALALHRRGDLRGGAMACTVMSNLGLHEAMKNAGIEVVTTGVGDRQVIDALRKRDLSFGGENSGHLIFADHATTGDGILSALLVLRIMAEENQNLAELAACMEEYPQELLGLRVKDKPPLEQIEGFRALVDEAERAFGEAGRQLIRYSGTEPKVRVLVEHRDAGEAERWARRFADLLQHEIGA